MSKSTTRYISTLVLGIIIIWTVFSYNSLVTANLAVDNSWAQVESQYQRRFDLIPNLVSSVQGVMSQEKEVFGKLADARSHYAGATTVNQKAEAAGKVEASLARLLVITENYPQLKSSENVSLLMAELSGTENRVAVERVRFNNAVTLYNTKVATFPGNIFAKLFSFKNRPLFKADFSAEKAPVIKLK